MQVRPVRGGREVRGGKEGAVHYTVAEGQLAHLGRTVFLALPVTLGLAGRTAQFQLINKQLGAERLLLNTEKNALPLVHAERKQRGKSEHMDEAGQVQCAALGNRPLWASPHLRRQITFASVQLEEVSVEPRGASKIPEEAPHSNLGAPPNISNR